MVRNELKLVFATLVFQFHQTQKTHCNSSKNEIYTKSFIHKMKGIKAFLFMG